MALHRIILRRLTLGEGGLNDLVTAMNNMPFDLQEGRGFLVEEQDTGWVRAFYIIRMPTFENHFDLGKMKVVREQVESIVAVPFTIDMGSKTLDVGSSQKLAYRVVDELSALSRFTCVFEDVQLDPIKVLRHLRAQGWNPRVTRIKVKDFVLQDGVVGDVTFKVTDIADGHGIVERFSGSIQALTLILSTEESTSMQLTITRGGTISLPHADDFRLIQQIKTALVNGG